MHDHGFKVDLVSYQLQHMAQAASAPVVCLLLRVLRQMSS